MKYHTWFFFQAFIVVESSLNMSGKNFCQTPDLCQYVRLMMMIHFVIATSAINYLLCNISRQNKTPTSKKMPTILFISSPRDVSIFIHFIAKSFNPCWLLQRIFVNRPQSYLQKFFHTHLIWFRSRNSSIYKGGENFCFHFFKRR